MGALTLHPLSSHAAGIRVRAPDALPVAVGGLADHGIVDAVAQDLLGRLDGEVARVPWSTDIFHYVLGHRLEFRVVALDLGWPILVEFAPTHLRLRVAWVHPGEIVRDAAVLGEPYHRVYTLVRGLGRVQAPRVLAHRSRDVRVPSSRRRLVIRHYPGEADAVVQTVVDVVVGAHRVRDRVHDPQKGAREGLRGDVLRPAHGLHRVVVVRVVGRLAQVRLHHLDGLEPERRAREVLDSPYVS